MSSVKIRQAVHADVDSLRNLTSQRDHFQWQAFQFANTGVVARRVRGRRKRMEYRNRQRQAENISREEYGLAAHPIG